MKKLFLCSYFAGVKGIFKEHFGDMAGKDVCFIPTAALNEEVDFFVDEAREVFKDLGARLSELDLSTARVGEATQKISKADFIYVSGGNTFFLLEHLQNSGADALIKHAVSEGAVYIGESTGAFVAAANTEYAKDMDECEAATESFEGLSLIYFYPLVHFGEFAFEESTAQIAKKYANLLNLVPISNSQAIFVDGNLIKKL